MQKRFEELRNAEYAEVQRLEDAERRRTEEKERRIKEQLTAQKEKLEVAEKIEARAFAKSYLQSLIPNVLGGLASNGYFFEVIEKEIESQLLPWLTTEVEKNLKKQQTARAIADGNRLFYSSQTLFALRSQCIEMRRPKSFSSFRLIKSSLYGRTSMAR